jgi:hypothetical protein
MPISDSEEDEKKRLGLWKKFDFNSNGKLSLMEIETVLEGMG